jgi:hypothetical protein
MQQAKNLAIGIEEHTMEHTRPGALQCLRTAEQQSTTTAKCLKDDGCSGMPLALPRSSDKEKRPSLRSHL